MDWRVLGPTISSASEMAAYRVSTPRYLAKYDQQLSALRDLCERAKVDLTDERLLFGILLGIQWFGIAAEAGGEPAYIKRALVSMLWDYIPADSRK